MQLKNILNAAALILLTACGGGGGGGSSQGNTSIAPPPPPPTYEFPGTFYYSEQINQFEACIDLNINITCDSQDIGTVSFSEVSENIYSFVISTQNSNIESRINNSPINYQVEINTNSNNKIVLRHPGIYYLRTLGISSNPFITPFSSIFSGSVGWVQSPGYLYLNQPNSSVYQKTMDDTLSALDSRLRLINDFDGISSQNFFGDFQSNTSCCINNARADIIAKHLNHSMNLKESLRIDVLESLNNDETYFLGYPLQGRTPTNFFTVGKMRTDSLRVFLSDTFPNDTTGSYTDLNESDNVALPHVSYLLLSVDNLVNGWDAYWVQDSDSRLAEYNDSTYLVKNNGYCEINPGFACRSSVSMENLVKFSPYISEIYKLHNTTSGNEIDSFLDIFRLIRFDFSNGYEEVLCRNWEAAERFNVSNSGFQRIRIERGLDAGWNGSQCDVYGNTEWKYQYGYRYYEDTGSAFFITFGSTSYDGYFSELPFDIYQEAQNISSSSNSINGILDQYLKDFDLSIDFLADLITRLRGEDYYSDGFIRISLYPGWENRRNFLLIRKQPYGGLESAECSVDGEIISVYYYPSDQQLEEVIDQCLPYISNGFNFSDESEINPFSPYEGSSTSTSYLRNNLDDFFEQERFHRDNFVYRKENRGDSPDVKKTFHPVRLQK